MSAVQNASAVCPIFQCFLSVPDHLPTGSKPEMHRVEDDTSRRTAFRRTRVPAAFAQAPRQDSKREEVIQPDQMRDSKIIGSAIYDVQKRDIGKVGDLGLDRDGRIGCVVPSRSPAPSSPTPRMSR
jgi:PRC-barrel domain protein